MVLSLKTEYIGKLKVHVNPKWNQSWIFIGKTDAEAETPILWPPDAKSQLIGKDLMLAKIKDRRRGQQRMRLLTSLTPWTWVWASSGRWWWTGKPGVLQSMWSQRVWHDWATELNWTDSVYLAVIQFNHNEFW